MNWVRMGIFLQVMDGFSSNIIYNTLFVNLLTTNPSTDGTLTKGNPSDEIEWGVVRKAVSGNFGSGAGIPFPVPTTGGSFVERVNGADIAWTAAEVAAIGVSVPLVGVGLYDALTAGNLVMWDVLDAQVTAVPTNSYKFPAGNLKIRQQGIV